MAQVPMAILHVLFAALSLILCAHLVTNFDQLAFSQEFDSSNTNLTGIDAPAKLLRYTDPRGLFTVEYPADWIASTSGLQHYSELIAFYSALQNVSDSFPSKLTISTVGYAQNITLEEYTNITITRLNQSQLFDFVSSDQVTLAGFPAYRVVLEQDQPFQNNTVVFSSMNTWTTLGNKVYMITFDGEVSRFTSQLPLVERMLESFRISPKYTIN